MPKTIFEKNFFENKAALLSLFKLMDLLTEGQAQQIAELPNSAYLEEMNRLGQKYLIRNGKERGDENNTGLLARIFPELKQDATALAAKAQLLENSIKSLGVFAEKKPAAAMSEYGYISFFGGFAFRVKTRLNAAVQLLNDNSDLKPQALILITGVRNLDVHRESDYLERGITTELMMVQDVVAQYKKEGKLPEDLAVVTILGEKPAGAARSDTSHGILAFKAWLEAHPEMAKTRGLGFSNAPYIDYQGEQAASCLQGSYDFEVVGPAENLTATLPPLDAKPAQGFWPLGDSLLVDALDSVARTSYALKAKLDYQQGLQAQAQAQKEKLEAETLRAVAAPSYLPTQAVYLEKEKVRLNAEAEPPATQAASAAASSAHHAKPKLGKL